MVVVVVVAVECLCVIVDIRVPKFGARAECLSIFTQAANVW